MFERQLAEVWDLIYRTGRGKEYRGEAEMIAEVVRARNPHAATLLDVGCGTGEHVQRLAKLFDHVEGMDLSPHMVAIASAKVPQAAFHVGDMCDFDLGQTFDAVVSLYTVVGYLPSIDALGAAIERMVAHLAPDGVLIVEPWWFTEKFVDGYIAGDVVRGDGRTVSRVSRTERRGDHAHMDIHYVVADEQGMEHFTEKHVFSLWSQDQYLKAFSDAGLEMRYVEDALYCGMFVGQRR
ncbi:class I SAM-dependent methyltransferase [Amycolatopsis sp. NPDC051716]|uniref:class I SAM-dependent methyltransferase n=1 Tax=Amycolatopsis sp. NPDC051716 TaxID=3155804 RepID=UPI003423CEEB